MFELIGMAFVAWLAWKILDAFLSGKARARSQEVGKEARRIAIHELGVPEAYYNHCVINDMDNIKNSAMQLRGMSEDFKDLSWPRLLARTIHGGFYHDCQQYDYGNPVTQERFDQLDISPDAIYDCLNRRYV